MYKKLPSRFNDISLKVFNAISFRAIDLKIQYQMRSMWYYLVLNSISIRVE